MLKIKTAKTGIFILLGVVFLAFIYVQANHSQVSETLLIGASLLAYTLLIRHMLNLINPDKESIESGSLALTTHESNENKFLLFANDKGTITRITPSYGVIAGYKSTDVIGMPISLFTVSAQRKGFVRALEMKSLSKRSFFSHEPHTVYAFFNSAKCHLNKHCDKTGIYDSLTSLPSRGFLKEKLEASIEKTLFDESFLFVCLIDLDGFKTINDVLGRGVGDGVLLALARKLKLALGENDVIARVGGDEFAVLMIGNQSKEAVYKELDRLMRVVKSSLLVGDNLVKPSASIGVSIYPGDSADAETLVRHASSAMLDAKLKGGNQYKLFNANEANLLTRKSSSIDKVLKGINSGQMVLFYQPKMDVKTKKFLVLKR
ncbi:GGDEF domain-containing protein [Thiomicrorhabdus aquaedulcis]|uniref:GGDEF domain-containing protein n=1 Tax=Thiomicrorhabdus aquaedulcis TaxID=2211106 RepID=UPI000FD95CB1|nr:GGDEF domain-containing protein [Thiomicrorhabdus aquaedulcis]